MTKDRRHILERRSRRSLIAVSLLSAIIIASSCREDTDGSAALVAAGGRKPAERVRGTAIEDGGVHRDAQVLHVLLTESGGEMKRAKIAGAKATDDGVKDFAALMITDHTTATERLKAIAEQKRMTPEPNETSKSIESEDESSIEKLDRLSGFAFDRGYIEAEILGNLKAMSTIERLLAPAIVDPDLAAAVEEARVSSVSHRERAQEILRALRSEASASASDASVVTYVKSNTPDASAAVHEAGTEGD
jgi:putative membrane protein